MDTVKFAAYMKSFEESVIIKGFESGIFDKKGMVPYKKGKLHNTDYGKAIGIWFAYDKSLAVDYYGLVKKSDGLCHEFDSLVKKGIHVTSMKSPLVFFASVKIETVQELCSDLVADFPAFKAHLIQLRGFKKQKSKQGFVPPNQASIN